MYTTLAVGFSLGLSVSGTCALVCLPVLAPYVAAEHPTVRKGLYASGLFTGGRLVSYLILGLLFGLLAEYVDISLTLLGPGYLAFGGLAVVHGLHSMGLFGIRRIPMAQSVCQYATTKRSSFYLGTVSGLKLCLPLITALTYSMSLPGLMEVLLFMLAFWGGSSIWIFLAGPLSGGLAGAWVRKIGMQRVRSISGIALVVVGIAIIAQGAGLVIYHLGL